MRNYCLCFHVTLVTMTAITSSPGVAQEPSGLLTDLKAPQTAAYGIGSIAAFWVIQRVSGFF